MLQPWEVAAAPAAATRAAAGLERHAEFLAAHTASLSLFCISCDITIAHKGLEALGLSLVSA
jgi:hypothetical protein